MRLKPRIDRPPYAFIALCVLPPLILTLVFMVWPTLSALALSFTNSTSLGFTSGSKFVGLENYIYMFQKDPRFIKALTNTLKLLAVVPIVTVASSLFFAFLLTQVKLRERGAYRILYFLPSVISMSVVGIVWTFVFDPRPDVGVLNRIIAAFGGQSVAWLGDGRVALWCVAIVLVWQAMGYYMVMLVASIDGISPDIYEAASIDGANQRVKLFRITMPLLRDSIGITFVLSLSGTINLSFMLSNIMTDGGPADSSLVLLQYMYKMAFGPTSSFGYAMAITVFSLALAFILSAISRRLSSNENAGKGDGR